MYKITFYFEDKEELIVHIPKDKLDLFMTAISTNKVYMDDESEKGFWLSVDKLKYFEVRGDGEKERSSGSYKGLFE